jgi:hypothetical protein
VNYKSLSNDSLRKSPNGSRCGTERDLVVVTLLTQFLARRLNGHTFARRLKDESRNDQSLLSLLS